MMNRSPRSRFARLVLGSALLIPALFGSSLVTGCSPPPDNSPVVRITSPTENQEFAAGSRIKVEFEVGGIDESSGTAVKFALDASGDTRQAGRGKVRAFLSTSNFVAQTGTPSNLSEFLIPDPQISDPATLVTVGKKKLTLQLYYNDNTVVSPQRTGEVNIVIK